MIIVTSNILFSALPLFFLSLAVVFIPYVSKAPQFLTTIVHEIGHGIVAIPFGGRIARIKLHSDGSGSTEAKYGWFLYHPVRLLSLLMGYGAPLYVGLALVIASYYNQPLVSLWILGITGILTLFAIRNWMGFLIISLYNVAVITLVILNSGSFSIQPAVYVIGFILIIRGITDIVNAGVMVFKDEGEEDTDFHIMEEEMLLPSEFWYIFFCIFHIITISYLFLTFFPIVLA